MDKNAKSIVIYFSAQNHTRNIATKYKTVFIGYPIWWGVSAWPVAKSASGNWQPGHRFSQDATDTEVKDWIQSL